MKRFGQSVRLSFTDESKKEIFYTDSLRIDFDVRSLPNTNRAKVQVYNLNAETISSLDREGVYISLYTSLHGGAESLLIDNLYVNNMATETKVPNSITTFYCYDGVRRGLLDSNIDITLEGNISLRGILDAVMAAGNAESRFEDVKYDTKFFPDGYLDHVYPIKRRRFCNKVGVVLDQLCSEFKMTKYSLANNLLITYRPVEENVTDKMFLEGNKVILALDKMKQNPVLGAREASVTSNLDSTIVPSSIIDVSQLVNARTVGDNQSTLEANKGFLKRISSGVSSYVVTSVQHLGSNYTASWDTKAHAKIPRRGDYISSYNWSK